ncbi:Crp/Fnr family transcriptional regulator [Polluticoccus soli]|uniref:Crp/Fnr family transcriptional regulator n=1 Tax=Polluticoccus soli TaxID=3034150 RepID=UPI0023E31FC4|nr:Crp/Fnr family transcriptional regulator [Flavipsychrobacter sp. JY13-12]
MPSIFDNFPEGLSADMLQKLKSNVTTKQVSKGQILLRKGEKVGKAYFVRSGCLRSYAIDEKGKEHVFMFAPEGWIITDIGAHIHDKPAELFIDALEDSEVEVFNSELFSQFNEHNHNAIMRLLKRNYVLQKRIIMLMSATLQERYLDFIETYPDIVQRVPQKMIASYLGVTPEALSKVRSELAKKP